MPPLTASVAFRANGMLLSTDTSAPYAMTMAAATAGSYQITLGAISAFTYGNQIQHVREANRRELPVAWTA